jgi:hypothetical protein
MFCANCSHSQLGFFPHHALVAYRVGKQSGSPEVPPFVEHAVKLRFLVALLSKQEGETYGAEAENTVGSVQGACGCRGGLGRASAQ